MSGTHTVDTAARHAVLVPVKPPSFAKSRLGDLGDPARRELATAFALDTVAAASGCPVVERVLVVTDDHELGRRLLGLGVDVIPDGTSDDLNETLRLGAAELHRRAPSLHLAAVCADLPALRPHELASVLTAARADRMTFVSDEERVGTTVLASPALDLFRPAFGPASRQRHLDAGAEEVRGLDVPSLRRDVDDRADLAAALRLGVGPRTALAVAELGLEVA